MCDVDGLASERATVSVCRYVGVYVDGCMLASTTSFYIGDDIRLVIAQGVRAVAHHIDRSMWRADGAVD